MAASAGAIREFVDALFVLVEELLPEALPSVVVERASTAASLIIGVYLLSSVYYTRSMVVIEHHEK